LTAFFIGVGLSSPTVRADDKPANPKPFKHQITGLFCPEREQHLRDAFAQMPQFKLVSIDFQNAEATVEYDPAKTWPNEKPERYVSIMNDELGRVSRGTFGVKPLRTKPIDKLKRIEIAVVGLDCLGCSYGAYRTIYQLPGVETATADFKKGKVTALIDPEKIDRAKLEAALKAGGVELEAAGK
jgi:copper chaperone CopZ